LGPSGPKQCIRRESLKEVIDDLAGCVFNVDVDVGVWIGPLDLRDFTFYSHAFCGIELRGIGVMCHKRDCCE